MSTYFICRCRYSLYEKVLISQYNTSIAVVSDSNGPNTGVMFIKNTHWTKSFFDIIKKTHRFDFHHWWEQKAIHEEYNKAWVRNHFTLLNSRYNSYKYKKDTLIYHTAGCTSHCFSLWSMALNSSSI